uniref:Uncharacterized protein n=1 Tax=Romanomermis culicivorax TaxID=13658 RepID=A0A915IBY0_ROMCU
MFGHVLLKSSPAKGSKTHRNDVVGGHHQQQNGAKNRRQSVPVGPLKESSSADRFLGKKSITREWLGLLQPASD